MATALVPAIYDETLADENIEVGTEAAYRMVKVAAREEGLLLSPSAAAALLGCLRVAKSIPADHALIVTVFADSAAKYLSERFWDEE
jgi:cysteine synthase B